MVDRTNEDRKPIGRKNVKLYTRGWNIAHPNMTSKLPRLSDAMCIINIGRIQFRSQLYLNANANFAGLENDEDVS